MKRNQGTLFAFLVFTVLYAALYAALSIHGQYVACEWSPGRSGWTTRGYQWRPSALHDPLTGYWHPVPALLFCVPIVADQLFWHTERHHPDVSDPVCPALDPRACWPY